MKGGQIDVCLRFASLDFVDLRQCWLMSRCGALFVFTEFLRIDNDGTGHYHTLSLSIQFTSIVDSIQPLL
jgi:hypothetical protein